MHFVRILSLAVDIIDEYHMRELIENLFNHIVLYCIVLENFVMCLFQFKLVKCLFQCKLFTPRHSQLVSNVPSKL